MATKKVITKKYLLCQNGCNNYPRIVDVSTEQDLFDEVIIFSDEEGVSLKEIAVYELPVPLKFKLTIS